MKICRAALYLFLCASAFGQSTSYFGTALNTKGLPLANQNVAVCTQPANTNTTPCSPLATLATSTLTTSGGVNPLTTDSLGNYKFYAVPGLYTVQIYGPQVATPLVQTDVNLGASLSGNNTFTGSNTFKILNNLFSCDQYSTTALCQAASTGGMLFPPGYSIGSFTNTNKIPVLDLTRVDWRGSISVRDFGAKGDGSTDDTTAIQNAIYYACTGTLSAPTSNTCTSWVSGTAVGGTVYFPAGDYHTSAPLQMFGGVRLLGAGKLISKITKTTNSVGSGSITAGTGVGRSPTACGGGTCVDSYAVDSIISVFYISSGNTDYAYRWSINDLALYGSGANGTKYGIYAPRAAQFDLKNLYIFMNCSQGAPANCGSVQGSGFYTEDSWLVRHEGVSVDSSYYGWNHVNDGSNIGTGTSTIFSDDWAVNIGCSGFHIYGLSYSNMNANAVDHFDKKGTDLAASDLTCAPYSFNTASGISINGGGAEDITGSVMYAAASSVTISGGFKTFTQTGYTSAGTLATLYIDNAATVTMNGTGFSAITSPGNAFNIVLQSGSTLIDTNATLPSGGNTFIGYGGSSLKIDSNNSGITLTNASGNQAITPTSNFTKTIASGTAAMTTAAITAGNCGSTVTVAASGIATTDTITWAFNAAPAGSNAGLVAWPTSGNVNFAYCPNSAETPAAATINWRVVR